MQEFRESAARGLGSQVEMDQPELNAWLGSNLALKRDAPAPPPAPTGTDAGNSSPQDPTIEEVKSSVRDVKIQLEEDSLRAYVSFELYGKTMSLEMEGRLMVQDGCLRLQPTAGKLGSLPLMSSTLESAASRLFDSPENREKFRLPPEIRDVAVRHGRLVVTSR
jgi:hypothetical protein